MDYFRMPNWHAVFADYSNGYLRLRSERFNERARVPWNFGWDTAGQAAADTLAAHGFKVVGKAETKTGYLILTETFSSIKDIGKVKKARKGKSGGPITGIRRSKRKRARVKRKGKR